MYLFYNIYTVLYTLDWESTLPKEWKNKRNGALKKSILLLVYMVVALLETALSAAASVIFSRLLMSGDVEQNPGPGIEVYSELKML